MITSFSVGAIFEIDPGNALATLGEMAEQFTRLEALSHGVQESLVALGDTNFTRISESIGGIASAFEKLSGEAATVGETLTTAFAAIPEASARSIEAIDAIASAYDRARSAAASFDEAAMASSGGAGRGPTGPGGIGGRRGSRELEEEEDGWNARARRDYPNANYINRERDRAEQRRVREAREEDESFDEPVRGRRGGGHGEKYPGINMDLPTLVEDYAVTKALESSGSEEQSIDLMLLRGFGIRPSQATAEQKEYLQGLVRSGAQGTGFSEAQVASGGVELAAPLGFRGEEGMKKFGEIFEFVAKASEAADKLRIGKFDTTMSASVEYAHETGRFGTDLRQGLNVLGAITESLPHGDMGAEARTMSYSVPFAKTLGIDPDEAAIATGFLQRAGLRQTTAATTYRQLMVGLLKAGSKQSPHLAHHAESLARAMRLTPEKEAHLGGKEHEDALVEMGLEDRATHQPLFLYNAPGVDPRGHVHRKGDVNQDIVFERLSEYAEKHTAFETGRMMYKLAGVRGQGSDMITENAGRYSDYSRQIHDTAKNLPLDQQLGELNESLVQKSAQVMARANDLGKELGDSAAPLVKRFETALISAETTLTGFLHSHPAVSEAAAMTAGGVAVGTTLSAPWLMRRTVQAIGNWWHGGAGATAGAAEAAEAGRVGPTVQAAARGGLAGGIASGVTGVAVEGITDTVLNYASKLLTDTVFGSGTAEKWKKEEAETLRRVGDNPQITPGPHVGIFGNGPTGGTALAPIVPAGPRAAAAGPGNTAPPAPTSVTINLGGVTNNGVADENTFSHLMTRLTNALSTAMSHNSTGTGQGSDVSIYTGAMP